LAISKERKKELVDQYIEMINSSTALFLTEYTGLSVKDLQKLRGDLREVDGTYLITKNTLLRLALEQTGRKIPDDLLVGQLATGFALNESTPLAKVLVDFAKVDDEIFTIKFGIMGDELLSVEQVEALAALPSRDELRAQLLGALQATNRSLLGVLSGNLRQLVTVLDAYVNDQENEVVEAT
jgi:large subunit ribosomal protein L10